MTLTQNKLGWLLLTMQHTILLRLWWRHRWLTTIKSCHSVLCVTVTSLSLMYKKSQGSSSTKLMAKLENDHELGKNLTCCPNRKRLFLILASVQFHHQLRWCNNLCLSTGDSWSFKKYSLYLWQVILKAFSESVDLPWPPTADELDERANDELPEKLKRFLNLVLSGSSPEMDMYMS